MKVCHENNYLYIHLNTVIVGCIDKAIKENKNMGSATDQSDQNRPGKYRIYKSFNSNTKIAYTAFEMMNKKEMDKSENGLIIIGTV